MNLRVLITAAALAGSAGTPSVAQTAPADLSQRLLDELAAVNGVPGHGAAIWRGGRVIWTGSTGYRDVERKLPVQRDTIFRLASVSKLLTVTAAAKLAEQGRLDLDAPVSSVLPWLKNDWAPITARQLAAHTSGLPHYQAQDEGRGTIRYPDARAAVSIFADRPLLQPPGQAYSYSSWGYTLLSALVEQASGIPFNDYIRREVAPGLVIGPDATDSSDGRATIAYQFGAGGSVTRAAPHDFSYTWGGGGLGATPSALATFGGRMLRNEIVGRPSFDAMLRPYRLADGREVTNDGYLVGFGWRTSADEDGAAIAHHNGIALGARSALVLWRGEDMVVSLLSNALWTSSIDRTARMIAAPFRPLPKGLRGAACPVDARRYEGTFGDKTVGGTVDFKIDRGMCVGTLSAAGPLKEWLSPAEGGRTDQLRLVGIDRARGLARAGLVTPFGIYDWRVQADGSFEAAMSETRRLRVRLFS
jgi:serine beta-lactamase-like protein LACTB, mitochondrial